MTSQFKPTLQSCEDRLAPAPFGLSVAAKAVASVNLGVVLPGGGPTTPVSPPVSPPTVPPPPPSPGGM